MVHCVGEVFSKAERFFCDSYVRPEIFMGMKHGVTENMECCQIERESIVLSTVWSDVHGH